MGLKRYDVTYAFDGPHRCEWNDPVSTIGETVAEMRREGIDVEFCGATQEIDAKGRLVAVRARYRARDKGTIGCLNCRGRLPACGSPQFVREEAPDEGGRRAVVAGG